MTFKSKNQVKIDIVLSYDKWNHILRRKSQLNIPDASKINAQHNYTLSRLMTNQQNDCKPSEDSDQSGYPQMPRLIWVFAGHMLFCWFCHETAQIWKRTSNHIPRDKRNLVDGENYSTCCLRRAWARRICLCSSFSNTCACGTFRYFPFVHIVLEEFDYTARVQHVLHTTWCSWVEVVLDNISLSRLIRVFY